MEEFFKWNDDWQLGVDEIDRQHQAMAGSLNRLIAECARQKNLQAEGSCDKDEARARIMGFANDLYEKTRDHFRREEELMREAGFPAYAAHVREHVMLLGELKATFLEKQREGCTVLGADILHSLKSWLVVHITRSDREFADYLHSR